MNQSGLNVTQFFWLLLISFLVALVARRVKVPYALALVVTGLVIGILRLLPQTHLEPSVLLTVFLPPLLFESAIYLRIEALRRDWTPIAIYTLAGTALSTFIVGGLMARALGVPFAAALVFGALISTTDPISVIAVFKRLGAGRRLTLIMEAESLFNNDTAVVLFTVMLGAVGGAKISVAGGIWQFLRLVIGGAMLGGVFGALASRVHYELNDHLIELTLTTVVAFGSYLSAEAMHVSGVMAVVVAGLVIGNYGIQFAMTPGTRLAVTAFWEYAGFVVNSLVFLLIGIEVADVRWADKLGVVLLSVLAVLIGRAAIYPLSLLVNRVGGDVPRAWQHILWWGGLRGALSMALVLSLGRDFPQRERLIAATFGVVLFSLLGQGLTIGPLLKRLGLTGVQAMQPKDLHGLMSEVIACQAALLELEKLRMMEAHPNWSVEMMMRDYRERLALREEALETLQPGYRALAAKQAAYARRQALLAEKNAYYESERQGWIEEEDWRQIAARIDAELLALAKEMPER
jgi:CPA1 family monovalent cation:H+ antiporter